MLPLKLEWREVTTAEMLGARQLQPGDWLGYLNGDWRACVHKRHGALFLGAYWGPGFAGSSPCDSVDQAKDACTRGVISSSDNRPTFVIEVKDGMVTGIRGDGEAPRCRFIIVDRDGEQIGEGKSVAEEKPVTDRRFAARIVADLDHAPSDRKERDRIIRKLMRWRP